MNRQNKLTGCILFVVSVVLVCTPSYANDEFKQWLQQEKSSFQQYKDERDKEFTEFLKIQWKEMELLTGFKRDESPKPVVMPIAKLPPLQPPKPEPIVKPVVPKPPVFKPAPPLTPVVKPVLPPQPKVVPKGRKVAISFFGSPMVFYYDPKLKSSLSGRIDENKVSGFWSALSLADYDALIEQINTTSKPCS